MQLSALLDFEVVPLDTEDAVSVLLDVTAPEHDEETERPPATLQVVLDRSGSMSGKRLEGAVQALLGLVSRLAPTDNFGLVTFDHEARVEVPAGPLTDREAVRQSIRQLSPGGSTDMSSGLLRGIQEARRAAGERGATLLLISDGHANTGVTDHGQLAKIAEQGYEHGITTTTVGYELGYDEALMEAVAAGGAGSSLFARDPDTAQGLLAQETEYLLAKSAQAVSLRIPASKHLRSHGVVGELPSHTLPDGTVMVELGDLYSGEQRRILLRLEVPGLSDLGTVTVTTLEVTYADPQTLTTYTVSLPINVNVVPGDEAAGRVPTPEVRAEEAIQKAQTAKREASEALRRGDSESAVGLLDAARQHLDDLAPNSGGAAHDVAEQSAELGALSAQARLNDANTTSKEAMASSSGYVRRRHNRQAGPGEFRAQAPGDDERSGSARGGSGQSIRGPQTGSGLSHPDDRQDPPQDPPTR